jgi:citrate lyase beta subunit
MVVSPHSLGATLYMPVVRPDVLEIATGNRLPGVRSIVLCLEDALAEADVEEGLMRLANILRELAAAGRRRGSSPLVFVRPRGVGMAARIALMPGMTSIDGFVAPKCRPGGMSEWFSSVQGTDLLLMPTLETREFFDPYAVADFRSELESFGSSRILALRIGGNDLLSCLGLRRRRGMTLYDGPLGPVLSSLACQFGSAGFSLTAPVCEIVDDEELLAAELARDVAHGFVGKTAIHPCQVAAINAAFAPCMREVEAAGRMLDTAVAVFKADGAMCEPATHAAWAKRVLASAEANATADARSLASKPLDLEGESA